jgi:hypothetical protein
MTGLVQKSLSLAFGICLAMLFHGDPESALAQESPAGISYKIGGRGAAGAASLR